MEQERQSWVDSASNRAVVAEFEVFGAVIENGEQVFLGRAHKVWKSDGHAILRVKVLHGPDGRGARVVPNPLLIGRRYVIFADRYAPPEGQTEGRLFAYRSVLISQGQERRPAEAEPDQERERRLLETLSQFFAHAVSPRR